MSEAALNGDLSVEVAVRTDEIDWTPSPSGSVWRKRVHRVGPPEAGQVTSVVRYLENASFPAHEHPDGEEILVLDGVFSDEHGDWPAGSYLLNPEGFRHAPFSRPGCTLFVKLRQYPGQDREHLAIDTTARAWQHSDDAGVDVMPLYAQSGFADRMQLERWAADEGWREREYEGGAELFVIDGGIEDDNGHYPAGSWLRYPASTRRRLRSPGGARLYVKTGGLVYLRSAD